VFAVGVVLIVVGGLLSIRAERREREEAAEAKAEAREHLSKIEPPKRDKITTP